MQLKQLDRLYDPSFSYPGSYPGKLIAFCGFDGSGKTTQLTELANFLKQRNQPVYITKQPTDWYRELDIVRDFMSQGASDSDIKIMALLSAADRLQHTTKQILPRLQQGEFVLVDRYVFSALALFQARGLDLEFLININAGIIKPDYVFFLNLSIEEICRRLQARDGNKLQYEEQTNARIERILHFYQSFAQYMTILDANLPVEKIAASIRAKLRL